MPGLRELVALHITSEESLREIEGLRKGKDDRWKPLSLSRELAAFKNLNTLELPQIWDDDLRTLRKCGLLHALSLARGKDGGAKSAVDVVAWICATPRSRGRA